jgi:hypothetical protein
MCGTDIYILKAFYLTGLCIGAMDKTFGIAALEFLQVANVSIAPSLLDFCYGYFLSAVYYMSIGIYSFGGYKGNTQIGRSQDK